LNNDLGISRRASRGAARVVTPIARDCAFIVRVLRTPLSGCEGVRGGDDLETGPMEGLRGSSLTDRG